MRRPRTQAFSGAAIGIAAALSWAAPASAPAQVMAPPSRTLSTDSPSFERSVREIAISEQVFLDMRRRPAFNLGLAAIFGGLNVDWSQMTATRIQSDGFDALAAALPPSARPLLETMSAAHPEMRGWGYAGFDAYARADGAALVVGGRDADDGFVALYATSGGVVLIDEPVVHALSVAAIEIEEATGRPSWPFIEPRAVDGDDVSWIAASPLMSFTIDRDAEGLLVFGALLSDNREILALDIFLGEALLR